MGFWKVMACVAGAVGAVVAAPIVLPAIAGVAAAAGTAVATSAVGSAVAGAAASAGTAIASSAVGTAVAGAASTVAGAATAAGGALASSAVGTAVAGAASSVAGAATAAGGALASSAVGTAVTGAASTVMGAAGVTSGGLAAASVGGGFTYSALTVKEAFDNFETAEITINNAKNEYEKKSKEIDIVIAATNDKLENLNRLKLDIYGAEVKASLALLNKIKNTKESSTDYFDNQSLKDLFSAADIKRMEQGVSIATDLTQSLKKGISLMSTTSGIASQLVGQFGFASTGTAISSLSGAAAQRATLAALGGGSIASGGAGMVGGQIMLGGLTLVPTAVMMSWKMASNSEKALTEAFKYHSEVVKAVEGLEQQKLVLETGIGSRIAELATCLNRLRMTYSKKILPEFVNVVNCNQGQEDQIDFSSFSAVDKNRIALSVHFLKKMVDVMRVKVIDAKGNPNAYAKTVINEIESDDKIREVS